MGRIYKKFVVSTAAGRSSSKAKVDSGADQTILSLKVAKQLGLDVCRAPLATMRSVGDGRILGVKLAAKMEVGEHVASLTPLVPLYRRKSNRSLEKINRNRNHNGH